MSRADNRRDRVGGPALDRLSFTWRTAAVQRTVRTWLVGERALTTQPGVYWLDRALWLVLFAVPTTVFFLAARLTPNPSGLGTHTQLGLPPCGFYVGTGLPCPGCGLTTSFAFFMAGDPVAAVRANPLGVLLFLVSFCCAATALLGFVRGWPVFPVLERLQAERWALLVAATSLIVWVVRVVTAWWGSS